MPVVMHTEAPADLSSWTPPSMVSEVGENGLRPSAILHQGTLTVAYESHVSGVGNTPRVITVATADGLGELHIRNDHRFAGRKPQQATTAHVGMGSSMWIDWIDDSNNRGLGDLAARDGVGIRGDRTLHRHSKTATTMRGEESSNWRRNSPPPSFRTVTLSGFRSERGPPFPA